LTYAIDAKSAIEKPIKIEIGTKEQIGRYLRFIRSIKPECAEAVGSQAADQGQSSLWSSDKLHRLNSQLEEFLGSIACTDDSIQSLETCHRDLEKCLKAAGVNSKFPELRLVKHGDSVNGLLRKDERVLLLTALVESHHTETRVIQAIKEAVQRYR
jgi:hypothetical protein